jgi:hypothetical protein
MTASESKRNSASRAFVEASALHDADVIPERRNVNKLKPDTSGRLI